MARQTLSLMALTPVGLSKDAIDTSLVKATGTTYLGGYCTASAGHCKDPLDS